MNAFRHPIYSLLIGIVFLASSVGVTSAKTSQANVASLSSDSLFEPSAIPQYALDRVDSLAKEGIAQGAFPGCQVFALYKGEVIYDKAFGLLMPSREGHRQMVETGSLYDLASITKAAATTPAMMLLVAEEGTPRCPSFDLPT